MNRFKYCVLFVFSLSVQLFSADQSNGQHDPDEVNVIMGVVLNLNPLAIKCGVGTLVFTKDYSIVLTAAHVVAPAIAPFYRFIAPGGQGQKYATYAVVDRIIHPNFNAVDSGYDIALLTITPYTANFTEHYLIDQAVNMYSPAFVAASKSADVALPQLSRVATIKTRQRNVKKQDTLLLGLPLYVGSELTQTHLNVTINELFEGRVKRGKVIAYKDLLSQVGCSGAPIFCCTGSAMELIGLHSGVHEAGFAFGTFMSKDIKQWFTKVINEQKDKNANQSHNSDV